MMRVCCRVDLTQRMPNGPCHLKKFRWVFWAFHGSDTNGEGTEKQLKAHLYSEMVEELGKLK